MLSKIIDLIINPFMVPHELCHYLVAQLLGVEAELHLDYVEFPNGRRDWQRVVIDLAPSAVGFLLFGVLMAVSYWYVQPFLVLLNLVLLVWWQYVCVNDFLRLWHYWRLGVIRPRGYFDR